MGHGVSEVESRTESKSEMELERARSEESFPLGGNTAMKEA